LVEGGPRPERAGDQVRAAAARPSTEDERGKLLLYYCPPAWGARRPAQLGPPAVRVRCR